MPEIRGDVTEEMSNHVDELVEKGLYKSKAEFIREKIREDMNRQNHCRR
mgnify:CR=1 FL=1